MNVKILTFLAAATVAMTGVPPLEAGEKERYLIGGLVGGWVLNDALEQPRQCQPRHVSVRSSRSPCAPVVVQKPRCNQSVRPSGHYQTTRVKTWVAGHHERVKEPCGRVRSRWVPGHYEIVEHRTRVENRSYRSSRSHNERRVSYSHWR